MSESKLQEFVDLVLRNLEKHGFPERSVSFPLEKMFESASQRGFSFNKVRDQLQEQGIATELTEDKVIFSSRAPEAGLDISGLQEAAQQILAQMSPEQLAEVNRMMQEMDPAEMERLKQFWESMPADERARRMEELQKLQRP